MQTHWMDKKIGKKTLIIGSIFLACGVFAFSCWVTSLNQDEEVNHIPSIKNKSPIAAYEQGYKDGQIDYANGIVFYALERSGDGSVEWKRTVSKERLQMVRFMRSLQPYKPVDIILLVNLVELSGKFQLNIRKGARCQMMKTSDGRLHVGYFDRYGVGESYWVVTNEFQEGIHFKYSDRKDL